ncbi:hypothetical protein P43SY_002507 [Pythium insidiosum]|uniref:Uncharacterized protein n=1 Tax=Pythium insidiosum TaxID=114742 RepID=A0AAD5MCF9_PYTIN|nr:hypothetical protein P43SY_002507 [Pythium insidiosum]
MGCGSGHIYKTLSVDDGLGGVEMLLQCDSAERLLLRDVKEEREDMNTTLQTKHIIVDEEFLPFPPNHFDLVMIDTDFIEVHYPNAFVLMEHLQNMGENSAVLSKGRPVTRDSLLAAASIYQSMYANPDGTVPATFQVIYLIGWAPHDSQPQPLRRGSAQRSLQELSSDQPQ